MNSCRIALICLAVLSVGNADNKEQAYSSVSYHRYDVPLAYNFSQIHIYSPVTQERKIPAKKFIPHAIKEIEPSNNLGLEHVYAAYNANADNANVDEISKGTEHDNNQIEDISPQNYNEGASHDVQIVDDKEVESPDYTVANNQAHLETLQNNYIQQQLEIQEKPQGFAYPKPQEYTVNNNNYFQSLPVQYHPNRLIKANLNLKVPKESLIRNNLGSPYNRNQLYFQNVIRNQNIQHPLEHRYAIPTVPLNEAHTYNIATPPNKAFTKIYNVERPQHFHEQHETSA